MNHTCDTGDRNLIKMSFEQRGFQNMFVRSSIFLSLCLSWLWITASSRSYGRGQGAIHASGNAINAALIWPITPTMETDPELLRLLITLPFAPLAALLRFFSTPLMAFSELTHGNWENLHRAPLPTRVDDGLPPFPMNVSINLTEVITHHPPGAMSGLPSLSSTSA